MLQLIRQIHKIKGKMLMQKNRLWILCGAHGAISVHTYVIGHQNPSVRITAQLLISLMLCALISYMNGGSYSLTQTLNDRSLRNSFVTDLFALKIFARYLPRQITKNICFFRFNAKPGIRTRALLLYCIDKPTQDLLDYDDFL